MNDFIVGLLSNLLGQAPESVKAALYKTAEDGAATEELSETAQEHFTQLFAQHLADAKISEEELEGLKTAAHNEGHKKGKFEALSGNEKSLREAYGVEGKNISEIVANAIAKSQSASDIEDKVLTHPHYIRLKQEYDALPSAHQSAIEALNAEWQGKVEAVQKSAERKERFLQILPEINAALAAAGVDLQSVKKRVMEQFLGGFSDIDFANEETGVYPLRDGKKVKNHLGHPQDLAAYVKGLAPDWFDIQKQPARQTPGNDPEPPGAPKPPSKWTKDNIPKNREDFNVAWNKETTIEARNELQAAYEASQRPQAA